MIILAEKEAPFDPDEPRDKSGQWVKKGSGDAKKSRATKTPSLKPARSRAALPAHIKALKLPPAWTDVRYAEDPDDDLQAVGKDAKGRLQYVYSKSFVDKKAAEKFERINALDDKMREIDMQVTEALKKKSEEAACLRLIMLTGIRPGSDKDTQAARQAFGATTLRGQHVVVRGSKVSLRFVGKKGVDLDIPVADPRLARELIRRKTAAGKNGKLFATSSQKLSSFTHSLDGGGFKTKDMRTYLGTTLAQDLIEKRSVPRTEKEYRAAVRDVARIVSQQLGNTPTVALQSYIAPASFAGWRQALDSRG